MPTSFIISPQKASSRRTASTPGNTPSRYAASATGLEISQAWPPVEE